jgi:hypothetical protein
MSVKQGNIGIVKDNLLFYYNSKVIQGFRGEATSNLANAISIGAQGGSLTVATSYPSFSEDLSDGNFFKNVPSGGVLYHQVTNPAFSNNTILYNNNGGLTSGSLIPISGPYLVFSFYAYLTQVYNGYNGGLAGYINTYIASSVTGFVSSFYGSYGWYFYVNGVLDQNWSYNTAYLNKWVRVVAVVNNGALDSTVKYFSNWYIYADRLTSGAMYIAKFQVEQKAYVTPAVKYDYLTNLSNRGETTTNLISNPDFTSTTGWNNNGNITTTIETINSKTYIKVVSNQGSSTPGILSDSISVTAGSIYTLSAFGYRSGSAEAYLYVYNVSSGTDILWTGAPFGTTDGWVVSKFKIPAGCSTIKVGVLWSVPSIGDIFYVEKMQLEQKEYQTAFVNGSRTANTIAGGGGLIDLSGNRFNASLDNSVFDTNGIYYNGIGTYVDTGFDITNLDPSQAFTIEAIVNFDAPRVYSPTSFTISSVNTTTNYITTSVTHNLVAGDRIGFSVSGGSLPSPLQDSSTVAPYYIINPTSNTFQVSTSSGGSAVDLTTTGSGTISASIPYRNGVLFGRAGYGGICIYYNISPAGVITVFGYVRTTVGGYQNTPVPTISSGVNYLITVVNNPVNNSFTIYLNGVSQGQYSAATGSTYANGITGNFYIGLGGQADGGGTLAYPPFKGYCNMQSIYRKAFSEKEIYQNYIAHKKTHNLP